MLHVLPLSSFFYFILFIVLLLYFSSALLHAEGRWEMSRQSLLDAILYHQRLFCWNMHHNFESCHDCQPAFCQLLDLGRAPRIHGKSDGYFSGNAMQSEPWIWDLGPGDLHFLPRGTCRSSPDAYRLSYYSSAVPSPNTNSLWNLGVWGMEIAKHHGFSSSEYILQLNQHESFDPGNFTRSTNLIYLQQMALAVINNSIAQLG